MKDISQFKNNALVKPLALRDYRLEWLAGAGTIPTKFSLRDKISKVKMQGTSSSCVAQATAYYVQLLNLLETGQQVEMSARDIYSLIYQPEGGVYVQDAFKKVCNSGVIPENEAKSYLSDGSCTESWMRSRSDITKQSEEDGMYFLANKYVTWDNTNLEMYKQAIIQGNGMVAVSWGNNPCWQVEDGKVLVPSYPSQMVWRHGIYFTGYDDDKKCFEFVNSWNGWGDMGFGYLPYEYVTKGYVSNPMTLIDVPNGTYIKLVSIIENLISKIKELLKLK